MGDRHELEAALATIPDDQALGSARALAALYPARNVGRGMQQFDLAEEAQQEGRKALEAACAEPPPKKPLWRRLTRR
jgi:hypothetical protein